MLQRELDLQRLARAGRWMYCMNAVASKFKDPGTVDDRHPA